MQVTFSVSASRSNNGQLVLALSSPNQSLSGEPTELFERALALDHDNPKAVWLSGMAAFEKQDYPKAAVTWQRLLTLMP